MTQDPADLPESSERRSERSEARRTTGGMPSWRVALGEAGPYLGLGLQIALTMAFYVGAGLGLDFLLETLPWLTITGSLIGLGAVLYHVVRVAGTLGQEKDTPEGAQRHDESRSKGA